MYRLQISVYDERLINAVFPTVRDADRYFERWAQERRAAGLKIGGAVIERVTDALRDEDLQHDADLERDGGSDDDEVCS